MGGRAWVGALVALAGWGGVVMAQGKVAAPVRPVAPSAVAAPVAPGAGAAKGGITGRVRLAGKPRGGGAATLPVIKDGAVCGHHVPDESLLLGKDGGVANVVVALRAGKTLPPRIAAGAVRPAELPVVDQKTCRYTPHVQAVRAGAPVSLRNSDGVFHNVHARLVDARPPVTLFNVPTPYRGFKMDKKLTRPGVVKFRCDAGHTWMSAWALVFEHDYFAVTNADGAFTMPDVPPGQHELVLWHEPASNAKADDPGTTTIVPITVTAGKATTVELTIGQ